MTIVNLAISHRVAPPGVLEKLAVPSTQRGHVLARLRAVPAIDEVAILSTCNRVEVYAASRDPAGLTARAVADVLGAHGRVETREVLRIARIRVGAAATRHLFTVACGLDSMAIGEDQIVAQIKDAARAAAAAGTAGPAITGLIDAALRASKRARAQTTIGTEGISLARAGVKLARACVGDLTTRHAVVVGAGSTGRLAARLLREAGVGRLSVASGNPERAAEVAGAHGRPLLTRDVPYALAGADILVTATGAGVPIVLASHVRAARALAGRSPLFVLDLGMPPDVEPAVGRLGGVTLVDIAALGRHVDGRARPGQVPQVAAIVAAETAAYLDRQDQAGAAPAIAALHARVRQLADAELARLRRKLPDLTDEQQAEVAATVHRIARKVLHQPTARAKELSAGPKGPVYLDALHQLFDLNTART
jgi:glutamyl-tRNA reductase